MRGPAEGAGGLTITALGKRFGSFVALSGVDLEIRRGEFLTLLGPSGSGKTTLLMLLAGFHDISEGDIRLDGVSIARVPAEKRNFGMVFQGYALFPHMSVAQNVAYPLEVRGWPAGRTTARVAEMLELVQLEGFADRRPTQLSGGQQQRVALARALAFSPEVLLLDEPLGALDKKLRVEVQAQLKEIHHRVGTTFIYVTHDQEEALSMSDRIVILNHGRVVQVGTPSELYEHPRTEFAAGFLGKSNLVEADGARHALRPEKIDIAPEGQGAAPARARGTVRSITYFGSAITLIVEADGIGPLEVSADTWRTPHAFAVGQTVELCWSDAAMVRLAPDDGG